MTSGGDGKPRSSLHEDLEITVDVKAGNQPPSVSSRESGAPEEALDNRMGIDLGHEGGADTDGSEALPTTLGGAVETESANVDAPSNYDTIKAPSESDKATVLTSKSPVASECMSDLPDDSTTVELKIPPGCERTDNPAALRDHDKSSLPCSDTRSPQHTGDHEESESASTDQHSHPGGTLALQTKTDEQFQTLNTPATSGDADALDPFTSEAVAVNTSKAPSKTPSASDIHVTVPSEHTVGVKRTATCAASALPELSWNDILRVQNLIERCLQQYLSKREILQTLKSQASINPAFADVVWQKLEEQNPAFFRAYHIQLRLKEQIIAFNYLVAQQKEMSAKRVKRRHVRRSSPAPASSRLRGGSSNSSSSAFAPLPAFNTASSLFSNIEDSSGAMLADEMAVTAANALMEQLPPQSPLSLPLPSPIKTELDTHAFFS